MVYSVSEIYEAFGSLLEVNILNLWKYIVSEIYESPLTESRLTAFRCVPSVVERADE